MQNDNKIKELEEELDREGLWEEFREALIEESFSDEEGPEVPQLLDAVENSDIDGVLMALCGWSSASLLSMAKERKGS